MLYECKNCKRVYSISEEQLHDYNKSKYLYEQGTIKYYYYPFTCAVCDGDLSGVKC